MALVYDEGDAEQKETELVEATPEVADGNDGFTVVDVEEDLPF